MDPKVKPHTRQTLVETFDQANYNSTPEYNVALETLLTYHVSICTAECSFSGMKPGGGGGTRYIPGWRGAARPLIP